MKTLKADKKRIVCSNPDSIFRYFGWPSVARLQDGTLALTCSGYRIGHVCPFGKAVISYSRDEGEHWTRPAPVIDTILDDRDSGIVPFGDNRVIMTSFNNSIEQQHIWNGGRSDENSPKKTAMGAFFEAYLSVAEQDGRESNFIGSTYRISEDGGYTFGPLCRLPVSAPHGPCRLNDGGLLFVGHDFNFLKSRNDHLQVFKMNDKDEFEFVTTIKNVFGKDGNLLLNCEPHSIQLPSGKIIVHSRVEGEDGGYKYTTYQSESYDGGKTFTEPHQILSDRGGAPSHLYLHSSGVLVSVCGYRDAPYGVRAAFSRDEGETWDTDYVLDMDGMSSDLGYPASVELKDGRMLTVFYENVGDQCVIMQRIWKMPKTDN